MGPPSYLAFPIGCPGFKGTWRKYVFFLSDAEFWGDNARGSRFILKFMSMYTNCVYCKWEGKKGVWKKNIISGQRILASSAFSRRSGQTVLSFLATFQTLGYLLPLSGIELSLETEIDLHWPKRKKPELFCCLIDPFRWNSNIWTFFRILKKTNAIFKTLKVRKNICEIPPKVG